MQNTQDNWTYYGLCGKCGTMVSSDTKHTCKQTTNTLYDRYLGVYRRLTVSGTFIPEASLAAWLAFQTIRNRKANSKALCGLVYNLDVITLHLCKGKYHLSKQIHVNH